MFVVEFDPTLKDYLILSYRKPSEVWDEITYQFSNFNGATVEG